MRDGAQGRSSALAAFDRPAIHQHGDPSRRAQGTRLGRSTRAARLTIAITVSLILGFAVPNSTMAASAGSNPGHWSLRTSALNLTQVLCPSFALCLGVDSAATLEKSTDFGKTWSALTLGARIVSIIDLSCPTTSACVAAVDAGELGALPQPPRFLVERGNTSTWQLVAPPLEVTSLNSVTCATVLNCLATATTSSVSAEMLSSRDGGERWTAVSRFGAPGVPKVLCLDSSRCVRASGGYTSSGPIPEIATTTTNGGASFSHRFILQQAEGISALACPSRTDCIAAGSTFTQGMLSAGEGAAYVTTNAGVTWRRVPVPSSVAIINSVSCVNARLCFAAASALGSNKPNSGFGLLLVSRDAGGHWSISAQGTDVGATTISCVRSGRCIAAGYHLFATR